MAGRSRRQRRKVMKGFGILVAFVLVIGVTVAVTWALLTKTSEQKINVFTGAEGLKLQLDETNWDGLVGEEESPEAPDVLGEDMAKNYSPDQEIPKDPMLTNTTVIKDDDSAYLNDSKEYVALRLTYQIKRKGLADNSEDTDKEYWETITYEEFQQLADVYIKDGSAIADDAGFNTTDWTAKDENNTVFYYNTPLDGTYSNGTSSNNATSTLFDYVKINPNLETDTLLTCSQTSHYEMSENDNTIVKESVHEGLAGFRIVVEGFAVQAYESNADITLNTAKTRLDTLMSKHPAPADIVAVEDTDTTD